MHADVMSQFNLRQSAADPFTADQSNPGLGPDNTNHSPSAAATIARARFLARHGSGAEMPRRQSVSKELRKALVAAEMVLWESFSPQNPPAGSDPRGDQGDFSPRPLPASPPTL
ncbi:MAG TPA: hypothetical protein DCY13_06820 [Verrucomicrobiales bacterium]|nr:hypothetical protein [Verrucomicrobiales bacterium]